MEFLNPEGSLDTLFNYQEWLSEYIADREACSEAASQFMAMSCNDSEGIHKWYTRILAIPFIGNCFVAESATEEKLFRTLWPNHKRLSVEEFRRRFYSDVGRIH